jgi:head-tail adaptor
MRAGLLRHRIGIQQHSGTRTAHGGTNQDYSEIASVWGEVVPLSGRELEFGRAVDARASHRITLRFAAVREVTPRHRLTARGRTFNILSILNLDERDRTLAALCEERPAV